MEPGHAFIAVSYNFGKLVASN